MEALQLSIRDLGPQQLPKALGGLARIGYHMLRTTLRKLRQQYYCLQLQNNFRKDFQHFAALAKDDWRFDISWSDRHPCLRAAG
jgi:hypothetical protein